MQPLRGYDSLALGNLLPDIAPTPLSPPNMPGLWNAGYPYASSMMAAQANAMPPRQSGITRESLRALKQAMVRIAPHVPPHVLQQHYIRRLAELSNPTPDTLYPVLSYDTPVQTGDLQSGNQPAPLSAPDIPSAMDSPFARAAMTRFATAPAANGEVPSVRKNDAPLSTGDLTSGIRPPPLSPPNMPSVMDSPFVRAAMARLAASPAAHGHVQPIRSNDVPLPIGDLTGALTSAPLGAPSDSAVHRTMRETIQQRLDEARGANLLLTDPLVRQMRESGGGVAESLTPVLGSGRAAINDFQNGDYVWGAVDSALALSDLTLGGAIARGALKYGLKGLWKDGSKTYAATRPWLGKLLDLPPGTEVHHALLHQKNKDLPDWLVNHPMNLMPMYGGKVGDRTTRELHNAVHGVGKKKFAPGDPVADYLLRIKHGWPGWAKVGIPAAAASAVGNAAELGRAMGDTGAAHPDWYAQPIFPN